MREHFHKLLADFRAKMRKEEASSGISPKALTATQEILEEITEVMANKPNIEKNEDELAHFNPILILIQFSLILQFPSFECSGLDAYVRLTWSFPEFWP